MTADRPTPPDLDCAAVDQLDAAYALGALDAADRAAVGAHLASCEQPHAALRSLVGAGDVIAASVEPVAPPAGLRDRLMATIAATPQESADAETEVPPAKGTTPGSWIDRWFGWLSPGMARGLAAAAVVVAIALGAWNVALQSSIASRDQQLQAVASAIGAGHAAFRASGSIGAGYVVDDGQGGADLVVANLAPLEANRIYELWLIGSDSAPVAVGTFNGSGAPVTVVPLERGLGTFTTFAVTIESHRVEAPTSDPVMVATLGG